MQMKEDPTEMRGFHTKPFVSTLQETTPVNTDLLEPPYKGVSACNEPEISLKGGQLLASRMGAMEELMQFEAIFSFHQLF